MEIHGMNLVELKQHAKAVSVLNDVLKQQVSRFGMEHENTMMAAWSLGIAFLKLRDYKSALNVYTKAWESVAKVWPGGNDGQFGLYEGYTLALLGNGDKKACEALAKEALARGIPPERVAKVRDLARRGEVRLP